LTEGPQAEALAADPAPVERFADFYQLQIQVSPARIRTLAGGPGRRPRLPLPTRAFPATKAHPQVGLTAAIA
jgi:hypothetical protein